MYIVTPPRLIYGGDNDTDRNIHGKQHHVVGMILTIVVFQNHSTLVHSEKVIADAASYVYDLSITF